MRKSVFVIAVTAAACSSVAFAGEVKKDKAQVPAVKATTMSDAQMDKVTAGDAGGIPGYLNSNGHSYGYGAGGLGNGHGQGWSRNDNGNGRF
jgi:hypothetical protein